MSKVIITSIFSGVGKASGKPFARVSYVNVKDGAVGESFVDPAILEDVEAVDLKELESLGREVSFDGKGRIEDIE